MFTLAEWGGGDPAVRGRVGVNGATARSEKGAEWWRDRYESTERVERYTHIHCSAGCLNSAGNLSTEELGLTERPRLQMSKDCWFLKQGK